MKFRESGMPGKELWDTFFKPDEVLDKLDIKAPIQMLVDIGCGYGNFLFPASRRVAQVVGVDIDKKMIDNCKLVIENKKISNIELLHGDVSQLEFQKILKQKTADYVMIFNLLHCEEPDKLLSFVYSLLRKCGKMGVIHWKYENTPRGPSMSIRPKPEQIIEWAGTAGFKVEKTVDLLPYHFGIVFRKI